MGGADGHWHNSCSLLGTNPILVPNQDWLHWNWDVPLCCYLDSFHFWHLGHSFLCERLPCSAHGYSALIALLFSVYLIYDTQQIMGGKKYEISPEEHIYASVQLYIDVVYIFLAILSLGRK